MKKFVCAILCLSMLFTGALNIGGAEVDATTLKDSIVKVKTTLVIPEECTKVSSHMYGEGDEKQVTITWENDAKDYKDRRSVSVTLDNNGDIIMYNDSYHVEQDTKIPKLKKSQCEKYARDFLKEIYGGVEGELRVKSSSYDAYNRAYEYSFYRYVGEVPVEFNSAFVNVNADTGEVISFSGSPKTKFDIDKESMLSQANNAIGLANAKSKYLDNIGLDLNYKKFYQYMYDRNNEPQIKVIYNLFNDKDFAINAVTGEKVEMSLYSVSPLYGNYMTADGASLAKEDTAVEYDFTEEELTEIENIENLISLEDAGKIIKNNFDILNSKVEIKDSYLYKNKQNNEEKYIWSLSDNKFNASLNAESGEVLSFYYYGDDYVINYEETKIDVEAEEQAKAKARETAKVFINKIAKEKVANAKLSESTYNNYSCEYIRQVNGIPYKNNSISAGVDKKTGKINRYNLNWEENAKFPALDGVITKEVALNKISEIGKFDLCFVLNDDKPLLVYKFENSGITLDAFNGERLNYNGEPYDESEKPEKYVDITGHPDEEIISTLLDMGYFIKDSGEKFAPDKEITVSEFYTFAKRMAVDEKQREMKKSLTRYELANLIAKEEGYGDILDKDIFADVYKDDIPSKYKGSVAITKALGLLDDYGDEFKGDGVVTRAEAAKIIYELMEKGIL